MSALILKQSLESAAVSLAYADKKLVLAPPPAKPSTQPLKPPTPTDSVSVVGMDESVGLENGEKWTDRSPTPTFPARLNSPVPPHRSPTPPAEVPNIYLEGPIPSPANQVLISNSETEEVEMEDEYDYEEDEDYDSENEKPVVLSGKVTLSVLSGAPGVPSGAAQDEVTEAPSFSADDYARATDDKPKFSGTEPQVSSALANVGSVAILDCFTNRTGT